MPIVPRQMQIDQKIHFAEPVNYQNQGDVDDVTCKNDDNECRCDDFKKIDEPTDEVAPGKSDIKEDNVKTE